MTQEQTQADAEPKAVLHRYLKAAREALLWKLDGLDEYDVRRPLTPTATNLLGLVKHVAGVSAEYFGITFGRPFPQRLPWLAEDAKNNADMWATADQSRDDIIGLYQRVWVHSDATIEELSLDAPGHVPWWGERGDVTLQRIMVHMVAELNRHTGHADILREQIDRAVGLSRRNSNVADKDEAWWADYYARVERAARTAGGRG